MSILPKQFKGSIGGGEPWAVLSAEEDNIKTVVALGIQAPPNTQFSINGGTPIYIGATGIYELNLQQGLGTITQLEITNAAKNENASDPTTLILVDVLYESSTTGGEQK